MTRKSAAACPACGAAEFAEPIPVGPSFSLVTCTRCSTARTDPFVSGEEIAAWYPESYYGRANRRFHPAMEALVARFRGRRAERIGALHPPGEALDIGCGRGFTLRDLRARGWSVRGVEISAHASQFAREELGIPVHVGNVFDLPAGPGSFDAVILWHVLEHVPDPAATLARCADLLRDDGLLILAVPNYGSAQARILGKHWFHLDVPRHYTHFSERGLLALLERTSFLPLDVAHFSLEQNPYGWIQSLENAAGLPPNLLYDILKRDGARSVRSPFSAFPAASVSALLAGLALVPPAIGLSVVEALLRQGGTIEVYARKTSAAAAG
jgi:2-polyprenyl-3-methyl-5-hydroxy-6-metoxy-1,4-benzoquinol methylase